MNEDARAARSPVRHQRRRVERGAARADAALVPAHIRSQGIEVGQEDRMHIRRKLGMRLGKFGASIERVSIRLEDANGPRGGVDQVCRIKVVLRRLPSVVVELRDASLAAAIDGAVAAAERAVRRSLQRRRMKPIKKKKRMDPQAASR